MSPHTGQTTLLETLASPACRRALPAMRRTGTFAARLAGSSGMTLIEMMVGLALSITVSLAVFGVLDLSAQSKQRTHASSDMTQVGGHVQLLIDRAVRSAGSGFAQDTFAWGCPLHVSKSSTQLLPRSTALPAPFASVVPGTSGVFRLAPVLIAADQTTPNVSGATSDVLIVMAGHSGQAEVPQFVNDIPTLSSLSVPSGVGARAGDLMLLVDPQLTTGSVLKPCLLTQVTSSYVSSTDDGNVSLSGTYYAGTINSTALTTLSGDTAVFNLGGSVDSPPNFQVIGVGDQNVLYSYDLLQTTGTTSVALADGVFEMHAVYGVDTNGDGTIDSWVAPTGTYAIASLMAGTRAAADTMARIKAVRIGVILRAGRVGKSTNTATSLTLFSSLGTSLTRTRTLSTTEQKYRYQVIEFSVPVVNAVLPALP